MDVGRVFIDDNLSNEERAPSGHWKKVGQLLVSFLETDPFYRGS